MFQMETDQAKNLVTFKFSQHVTTEETGRWREQLPGVLARVKPGFTLFSDLSELDLMDAACAVDIEWSMDVLNKAGIEKVVRVIPDPRKDIGLKIMSVFHYRKCVTIITTESLEEGRKALED